MIPLAIWNGFVGVDFPSVEFKEVCEKKKKSLSSVMRDLKNIVNHLAGSQLFALRTENDAVKWNMLQSSDAAARLTAVFNSASQ